LASVSDSSRSGSHPPPPGSAPRALPGAILVRTMRDEPVPGFRYHREASGEEWLEVPIKGELLNDFPMFNKGTGFTQEERDELGLTGVMPPRVVSMELQAERVLLNYHRQATDIDRYLQ